MRDYAKHVEGEKGYSLVEVMMAMLIFMVGILAIASMQTAAMKSNFSSQGRSEAVNLAQQYVEQLMAIPYDPSVALPAELDPANNGQPAHRATDSRYTVTWTTTVHGSIANALNVVVTVAYGDKGMQKSVVYRFLKTELT